PFRLDVVESPTGRDPAFSGGEKEDLVADIHALELVPALRDDAAPAVEVVARAEALARDHRLTFDERTEGALDAQDVAHLNAPVQAISTQSLVRRRIVLNLCAVIVFTILAEFEIMLVQPFAERI